MLQKLPKLFLLLLGALFIINILQAHFTELIFDEAYYWYYAKNIAWGYFDHPPMVAWLIRLSSVFFNGELGVRFMSCLLSVITVILLWLMIDDSKKKSFIVPFFVVVFSTTLLNLYGFFTLPDTPLLFFTALFLWVYKRFIEKPTVILSLSLGIVMAALMYSKYHAVLVIVFVLLSNLKLLRNRFAWLAVLVALLCYSPHFLWLYEHDFISIKYHLFDRPNQAYSFEKFTGGYFLNLMALFGFVFPLAYYILYKTKPQDLFKKALVFLTYGVLIFFFFSSFSKRVQTQWVIVISIPMILLVFNFIIDHERLRKWVVGLGVVNIIVLFYARAALINHHLIPIYYESHGNKEWVSRLAYEVSDAPVVFENSYRNAPMYEFYSGKKAISLNNINYRQNQYSIDDAEASVQHQKVFYVSQYVKKPGLTYPRIDGTIYYGEYIDNFESFRRLQFIVDEEIVYDLEKTYTMKVYNPYNVDISLKKLRYGVAFMNNYKEVRDVRKMHAEPLDKTILLLKSNDTLNFTFKLPKTKLEHPKYIQLGISENGLHYGINGDKIKLK